MGWAARPKEQKGNPKEHQRTATAISAEKYDEEVQRGGYAKVQFSDRAYAMDRHGTLIRLVPGYQQIAAQ